MLSNQRTRSVRGFTLLELLIVIIIIGIASTIIVLKAGNFFYSNKNTEYFAKDMQALLELARKQAIFSMNVLGLKISAQEYSFLKLDDSHGVEWKPLSAGDAFWAARNIPTDLMVEVHTDNTAEQKLLQGGDNNLVPQIIFLPSGEITPFTINIHKMRSSKSYTIQGTRIGNISSKFSPT